MSSKIRIAVLECDTPLTPVREKYGGYGGVFKNLLHAGARHADIPENDLEISVYDVVTKMEYPELADVDSILLTGSKHDSFADIPWTNKLVDFTRKVLAQDRVRLVGVCYGHQIIARAMDVKVGRSDRGWEIAVCDVDLTPKGQEVFGKQKLSIHQMHRDVVFEYPPNVEKLGHSPKCDVQGMLIPKRLITVQGHPEFTEEIERVIIGARHEQGIFSDEMYKDAMTRVADPHDGVVVAAAFLRFMLDGR